MGIMWFSLGLALRVRQKKASSFFLRGLVHAIPEINTPETTIISDRDKGLIASDYLINRASRVICAQHLASNVFTYHKGSASRHFRTLILNREVFDEAFANFEHEFPAAAAYVRDIGFELWAPPYMIAHRFGHGTCNIVESVNASLEKARHLPCIKLLDHLWNKQMDSRCKARKLFQAKYPAEFPDDSMTAVALQAFGSALDAGRERRFVVYEQGEGTASVEEHDSLQRAFDVDLTQKCCQCGHFQENGVLCTHAIAFCEVNREVNAQTLVPFCLRFGALRACYALNFAPLGINVFSLSDNENHVDCFAPRLNRAKGRPRTIRFRFDLRKRLSKRRQQEIINQLERLNGFRGQQQPGRVRGPLPGRVAGRVVAFPVINARQERDIVLRDGGGQDLDSAGRRGIMRQVVGIGP